MGWICVHLMQVFDCLPAYVCLCASGRAFACVRFSSIKWNNHRTSVINNENKTKCTVDELCMRRRRREEKEEGGERAAATVAEGGGRGGEEKEKEKKKSSRRGSGSIERQ